MSRKGRVAKRDVLPDPCITLKLFLNLSTTLC